MHLILHKKEIPPSGKKARKASEEMFKALAFCPGNKWCFPRRRHRWNAVSCTVVRLWVTAGTLASFVRCSPISRGNEEFSDCHLPFTKVLCHICMECFCWDQHYSHRVSQLHKHMEGHCPYPVQLDQIDATYDICYPKSSSLVAWGIPWYMNFT